MDIKTIQLSQDKPLQQGNAYRSGDYATIYERDGTFGFCYHGIGPDGNSYEGEDQDGFDSAEAAETEARQQYQAA